MMEAHLVPDADHFSYLGAVKANITEQILADKGTSPSFEFSERMLYQITH